MTATLKTWLLGAAVAVNALLTFSLVWTWRFIYQEFSYPIDFFLPLKRTSARATLMLLVSAFTVPLALLIYVRVCRELPRFLRVISLVPICSAAFTAVAFAAWRYLK